MTIEFNTPQEFLEIIAPIFFTLRKQSEQMKKFIEINNIPNQALQHGVVMDLSLLNSDQKKLLSDFRKNIDVELYTIVESIAKQNSSGE